MKYAISIDNESMVLSATYEEYATPDMQIVDTLPAGNITDYKYIDGVFHYDPLPVPEPEEPSWQERMEAQVLYTALMTDTLVEE